MSYLPWGPRPTSLAILPEVSLPEDLSSSNPSSGTEEGAEFRGKWRGSGSPLLKDPGPSAPWRGGRKPGGASVLPRQLSYGGMSFQIWPPGGAQTLQMVTPGCILESQRPSGNPWKLAAPAGSPKSPPSVQQAFFEHPPQVQAFLREKGLSAGHTVGLLPLHLLLPTLGTWRSPEGRQVLQGFLGSLRRPYWDDICLNPSPQA